MTIIGSKYDATQLPSVDGIGYTAEELQSLSGPQEDRGITDAGGAPPLPVAPPTTRDIAPPASTFPTKENEQ